MIFLTREIGLISRVLGNKDYLSNITISSLIAFLLRHRIARNCLIVALGACGKLFLGNTATVFLFGNSH